MLNIMIIDGYIRNEPKIIEKAEDSDKIMVKFQLATLNELAKKGQPKYMWVEVVTFSTKLQLDFFKTLKKDDFVTCIGSYSYQCVKGKYYAQMFLKRIDKKFASGNVPEKDIVSNGEEEKKSEYVGDISW